MSTPLLDSHTDKQIPSGYRLAKFQYPLPVLPHTIPLEVSFFVVSQWSWYSGSDAMGEETNPSLMNKDNAQFTELIEFACDL